jgi:Ca2+-binding RTX toxin-like protein
MCDHICNPWIALIVALFTCGENSQRTAALRHACAKIRTTPVMKRWIATWTLMAALFMLMAGPGLTPRAALARPLPQSGTLDQSNDVAAQSYVGTIYQQAQTFTAGRTGLLDQVELKGFNAGSPGQGTIEITAVDQNGAPTGPALGSGSYDSSTLPQFTGDLNSGDWLAVSISPAVQVSAGVQYAIVKPASDPFRVIWLLSIGNTYSQGMAIPDEVGQPYDYLFRTYVSTPATVPTCNGKTATIYVKDGVIVGGAGNGSTYTGTLIGTIGNDVIVGTEGKDTVDAKAGNDTICGLGGDDQLTADAGDDYVDGGSGKDTLKGSSGADTLIGGDNDDSLDGDDGNDVLIGGNGNDFLDGDKNNDMLTGNAGADRFKGGDGTDSATDFNAGEGDTKSSVP